MVMTQDRRDNKFRIDKTFNISNILGLVIILWQVISFGNVLVKESRNTNQKINIMWDFFKKDHPDLALMLKDNQ